MKHPPPHRIYRFGVFEADADSAELRKRGMRIRIQTQPFRVLALLLENAGEIITRDELQQDLWPDDTFVDFNHGLNSAVNKIRQALGDSAANPRFIETIPRQGYRFVAPVETVSAEPAPTRPTAPPPQPAPQPPAPEAFPAPPPPSLTTGASPALSWLLLLTPLVGIAALALLIGFVFRYAGGSTPAQPPPTPPPPVRSSDDGWAVRILAGQDDARRDSNNAVWESDRFYVGGDTSGRRNPVLGADEPFLFGGERYGSFQYVVAVPPGAYRVRLHFAETWFGPGNQGGGGLGSRRFDVYINGEPALENFEPMRAAGGANRAVVREFSGSRPDEDGAITIAFLPDVQNAMVNAIEIIAEETDGSQASAPP